MYNWKHKHLSKAFPLLLKDSYKELIKNDPLRMAGATAFFTTFALPPILIILLQVLSLVFNPRKIRHELFENLSQIIGRQTMHQVVEILLGLRKLAQNWFLSVGGFIFLIFVATTLFMIIKNSLNQLWKIRVNKRQSLWAKLGKRLQSVSIILIAGALFAGGLVAEGIQAFMGNDILHLSPQLSYYFNGTLTYIFSLIIVTIWFSILFRYLPDGRPVWSVALTGAFVTSILFNIGKLILHWLLIYSNINTIYGASGSIVLLLLFVFYTSLILYYGASFTNLWGNYCNKPIRPLPGAAHYRLAEIKEVI